MALKRSTQIRLAEFARRWGPTIIRAVSKTLRLEVQGWTRVRRYIQNGEAVVFQFWHGDMLLGWYTTHYTRPAAIVSQARDGDIASAVLVGMNFVTFRGSSNRGGREAYTGMMRYLRKRPVKVSAYASDGPRGPRRVLKPGTVKTAQQLKGYVVPVSSASKWALRTHGWDRFFFPLPFSRALVRFGEPIPIPGRLRGAEFDAFVESVSTTCREAQETVDAVFRIK